MALRARPLSPHMQIYRLPLNAILSISHRLTGLVLALGAVLVVAMIITAASGAHAYSVLFGVTASWLGQIVLFLFTAALYFHMCNGVRHLFWDAGYGFELSTARRSARLVLVVAAVLTVATWIVAYTIAGG